MKKTFLRHFQRCMIRPVIYQIFTRVIYALTIVLLWNTFANRGGIPLSWGLIVPAVAYALLCWLAFLRLDGIRVPSFDRKLFLRKKKPDRFEQGQMADYLDYKPVSFEELEPEEKDTCLIISNFITAAAFFIASICIS